MPSLSLDRMHAGQTGKVLRVDGGYGFKKRLEVLGIRPGTEITKVSGQIMRGPVIVRIGMTQIAIGFGMARRVVVEI